MTDKAWWNATLKDVDLTPLAPTLLPTPGWYWQARWFDILWRTPMGLRLYRPALGWPFFGYLELERP